jgi:putative thioredoxin
MVVAVREFTTDVLEASFERPVLVDFWAQWCAPCRVLGPVLERLASESQGRWTLAKVDIEEHPALAIQFEVQSIPAVKLFRDGQVVAEFLGALPEREVERWLQENLPASPPPLLREAREARAGGDLNRAQTLLREALAQNADDVEAAVELAELLFPKEPAEGVRLTESVPQEHPLHDRAQALRNLARVIELAQPMAPGAGAGPAAGAGSPQAWTSYVEGAQAFAAGHFGAAIEAWIASIRRDRKVDDDGARRACVALFELFGEGHPVTQQYRRPFSSALF